MLQEHRQPCCTTQLLPKPRWNLSLPPGVALPPQRSLFHTAFTTAGLDSKPCQPATGEPWCPRFGPGHWAYPSQPLRAPHVPQHLSLHVDTLLPSTSHTQLLYRFHQTSHTQSQVQRKRSLRISNVLQQQTIQSSMSPCWKKPWAWTHRSRTEPPCSHSQFQGPGTHLRAKV